MQRLDLANNLAIGLHRGRAVGQYSEEWWFANGQLAANQRAAVFEEDQNTLASIFSDAGMTIPLANPTTTDANGVLTFYAADGSYWIFVGKVGTGDSVLATIGADPDNPVLSVNGELPDGGGNVTLTAADLDAQPITTINALGDLYVGTGDNATTRLGVGADGEVLTADSGEPTGMKWAPGGGGGAVDSVNGQTGVVVLDATDVGADPAGSAAAVQALALLKANNLSDVANPATSRTNLGLGNSATRDVGTIAGTVAAGDDSRITGAQQRSTLTTKGDLYAATAAATVTRQGVGSDGQVLTADSAQATGMRWATPASAPVTSVNGETGAVVLDAADVGAIASTIVDAKGDLVTATAADTPSRLAVGTDGQVLRANSGAGTGLEWDTLDATDVGAVPTSRTLTAGVGMSGGGDLSADRTFDVDYGTTAGTAAEGNDSRITGAQQRSTLTTKGDIYVATASATTTRQGVGADGEVLTADSTQPTGVKWAAAGGGIPATILDAKGDLIAASAADTPARLAVGTDGQYLRAASGQTTGLEYHTIVASDVGAIASSLVDAKGDIITATADNTPARLGVGSDNQVLRAASGQSTGLQWATLAASDVGAIAASLLDAKGDIIVATANDTPARQAIGTNGDVLIADSAQTNGLKWAIGRSCAVYPRSNYVPTGGVVTARSSKTATLNAMFLIPFMTLRDATLSGIAFEVTANVGSATVRAGIYGVDSSMLPSGAAVADYGTTDASTTGTKTFSVSTALAAGLWYLAIVGQGVAPTLRHCAGFSPFVASTTFPTGTGLGWSNAWVQTGVSGGLPTIGSIADTDCPLAGVKF